MSTAAPPERSTMNKQHRPPLIVRRRTGAVRSSASLANIVKDAAALRLASARMSLDLQQLQRLAPEPCCG